MRVEKRKAEFKALFQTDLKCKDNSINRIAPKCIALGEQGNLHYSQSPLIDNNPSSELPMDPPQPDPDTIDGRVSGASGVSSADEGLRDDNDDNNDKSAESDEGEDLMEYPFDGLTNPEGAPKIKSSK